jgi:hypothetical protein
MFRNINGKGVLIGVVATLVVLKFVVPRVPALAPFAAKIT